MKKRASLVLGILLSANFLPLTTIAETQIVAIEDKVDSTERTENTDNGSVNQSEAENILAETEKNESNISEVADDIVEEDSEIENENVSQNTAEQQIISADKSRATNPISGESITLTTDTEEFHNYSTSSYAILGLSGTFTLDESQVTNGEIVKIADVSVSASIAGLEGVVSNNTSTTIKNESGEVLGTLSLEGTSLVLKISSDYPLKNNQEKFTFNNTTALKFTPTQDMLKGNVDVVETVTIGDSSVSITFYEQETYDLTTLTRDAVDLQLSSGTTGYASSRIYDIAYNQAGLTELQASNGASASSENLKIGDYQIASTLSSNVIPTGGTIYLATYIASENNSKLQTNNPSGLASLPATSHEKTVSLPLKTLPEGMSLNQMNSLIDAGVDATYTSKQPDGTYLVVQNISESTLTISEELLRDTTNASTTSSDPNGNATVEYYGKALNNRATQATSWVNFEYVDPSISNTVTTDLLDNVTGNVINSATKDSNPQEVIVEGQSTIKEHYVDENGNPLDNVIINHGWPTSDVNQGGEQYSSSAKEFEGYTLNTQVTSIPGVTLSNADKIANTGTLKVDYPKAGNITNIYYVYTKNPVAGGDVTAKYIDTEGKEISDAVVKSGNIGEDYTTEQKEIDGYTFKEVQGDASGKFTDQAQIVTYVYTQNDETIYEDETDNSGETESGTEEQTSNLLSVPQQNETTSGSKYLPTTGEKATIGLSLAGLSVLGLAGYYYFRNKK